MSKKTQPIWWTDKNDTINKAIEYPSTLHAKDGREFEVKSWSPRVAKDEVVSVTIEVIVKVPQEWDKTKPETPDNNRIIVR